MMSDSQSIFDQAYACLMQNNPDTKVELTNTTVEAWHTGQFSTEPIKIELIEQPVVLKNRYSFHLVIFHVVVYRARKVMRH
jgi:hypothetical protein